MGMPYQSQIQLDSNKEQVTTYAPVDTLRNEIAFLGAMLGETISEIADDDATILIMMPDGERMEEASDEPSHAQPFGPFREDVDYRALARVSKRLRIAMDRSSLDLRDVMRDDLEANELALLFWGATHLGISLKDAKLLGIPDFCALASEGCLLILARRNCSFHVVEDASGHHAEISVVGDEVSILTMSNRKLRSLLSSESDQRILVAKSESECATIQAALKLPKYLLASGLADGEDGGVL